MIVPTKQTKVNPEIFDVVIDELITIFEQISWLDVCFGRVQNVKKNGKRIPQVYIEYGNKKEYHNMLPHEDFGNYAFMDFPSVNQNEWDGTILKGFKTDFDVIIWFNYKSIWSADHENRTIYNVKQAIYTHLASKRIRVSGAWIEWDEDYDQFDDIYSKWDTDEEMEQFLMRPYGALKLSGTMNILNNRC